MWIAYSLSAAVFYAIVHVLDEYCVDEVFEKPWFGVITSSIASIVVFQSIPFVAPFVEWSWPGWPIIALAFLAGVLIQTAQALYFRALFHSEAGIVSAYWNIVPALLPFASYAVLGITISLWESLGIAILIVASVCLCLLDSNFHMRWKSLGLMLAAALILVVAYVAEEIVYDNSPFYLGFLTVTTGLIAAGIAPLLIKNVRRSLAKSIPKLSNLAKFFVLIEVVNLFAILFVQLGIDEGKASLVAAVESTMPAHVFIISLLLLRFLPRETSRDVYHKLPQKIVVVIAMCVGVYFVS